MSRFILSDAKTTQLADSLRRGAHITYQPTDHPGAHHGILHLLHLPTGSTATILQLGDLTDSESQACMAKAEERAMRLYQNIPHGHISALESRDAEKGLDGGAVKGRTYIFAFCAKDDIPYLSEDIAKQTAVYFGDLGKRASLKNEALIGVEMLRQFPT